MEIRCINITSINKQGNQIRDAKGDAIFFQERAAPKHIQGYWKQELSATVWNVHFGPVGDKVKGAGVGCVSRRPINIIPMKIHTKAMKRVYDKGKIAIYIVQTKCKEIYVINIYGETGGH